MHRWIKSAAFMLIAALATTGCSEAKPEPPRFHTIMCGVLVAPGDQTGYRVSYHGDGRE